MKANELRLGNLVVYPGWHKDGREKIWKVRDLSIEDEYLVVTDGYVQCKTRFEYFKPVPLTEEWLLKLGFERKPIDSCNLSEGCYYSFNLSDDKHCDLSFITGDKNGFMEVCLFPYEDIFRYKHVHQLQNLYFALTGQELTLSERFPTP